ncbi:hypothetical protein LCGC14_0526370 [marine sediment metagenome]|uniref:HNH nuclease domain-containing protein n=1 Tax=marine sediment metagenome TaxID=412755 RepID=A0A0F9SFE9_9ZZZZ
MRKLFILASEFQRKLADQEFEDPAEQLEDDVSDWQTELDVAKNWVDWLTSLATIDENRPVTWKRKQERGTTCCWCGLDTFVGVEHIIPRSAGGPKVDRWNLAWACYPCNHERAGNIGSLSYEWMVQYRVGLGATPEPTGWLYKKFLAAPEIPTKEALSSILVGP